MGLMKRLYHLRHLGRVDEPRWIRPPPPSPPASVVVARARTEPERLAAVYRRSKAVQLQMFGGEG